MVVGDRLIVKGSAWLEKVAQGKLSKNATDDALETLRTALAALHQTFEAENENLHLLGFGLLRFSRDAGDQIESKRKIISAYMLRQIDSFSKWKKSIRNIIDAWKYYSSNISVKDDRIVNIDVVSGETHDGGSAVVVFKTEKGYKLVYKPKPAGTDQFLIDFLEFLDEHGLEKPFVIPKTVEISGGVIQEFVRSGDKREINALDLGATCAILYILRATDIHHENITVSNGRIFLLDTETIFSLRGHSVDYYTPLDIGIFPSKISIDGNDAVDLSFLAKLGNEEDVSVLHRQTCAAFSRYMLRLLNIRERIVAFVAAYAKKRNFHVRLILRQTVGYIKVIRKIPSIGALPKQRISDLIKMHLRQPSSVLPGAFDAEIRSLSHYEVPSFRLRITDGRVFLGKEFVCDARSPIEDWFAHISSLTTSHVTYISELITQSSGITLIPKKQLAGMPQSLSYRLIKQTLEQIYSTLAARARKELELKAFYGEFPIDKESFRLIRNNVGLYNGWAGFGVFSVLYGRLLGKEAAVGLGKKILSNCYSTCLESGLIDFAMGLSGVLWAEDYLDLNNIVRNSPGLHTSLSTENIRKLHEKEGVDFVRGTSGVVFALNGKGLPIQMYQQMFADFLRNGLEGQMCKPLGIAHGTSGNVLALSRMARWGTSSEDRSAAISLVEAILAFEDHHFEPSRGWPDYRSAGAQKKPDFLSNWCSGAAGIGLARASLIKNAAAHLDEKAISKISRSIQDSRAIVSNSRFETRLDLCCGEAGKIDFLISAGEVLEQKQVRVDALARGDVYFQEIVKNVAGLTSANVGLFKGLSGMGYIGCRLLSSDIKHITL